MQACRWGPTIFKKKWKILVRVTIIRMSTGSIPMAQDVEGKLIGVGVLEDLFQGDYFKGVIVFVVCTRI